MVAGGYLYVLKYKFIFMKLSFQSLFVLFLFLGTAVIAQEVIHINAKEFKNLLISEQGILLDVRTPEETSLGQINNASTLNFYGDSFEDKLKLIQKNKTVFVYCRSGGRSIKAAKLLLELGQHKVYNLKGGIGAWERLGFQITEASTDADENIKVLTSTEFKALIATDKLVLTDFHTQWCVPCKKLVPIIEELEIELKQSTYFLRIDVDRSKALADSYEVVAVPTLLLFKNGEIVWRNTGLLTKAELKKTLLEFL